MTAQIRDLLEYNEEKMVLSDEPLKEYIKSRDDIDFIFKSTAWWRGYVCKWEIRDKKLYLIYLLGFIEGNKQVDLSYVFPGKKEVFADWYTGELRVPIGELLKYVHLGYESKFERDLFLKFKDGVLISEREIDNREEFKKKK